MCTCRAHRTQQIGKRIRAECATRVSSPCKLTVTDHREDETHRVLILDEHRLDVVMLIPLPSSNKDDEQHWRGESPAYSAVDVEEDVESISPTTIPSPDDRVAEEQSNSDAHLRSAGPTFDDSVIATDETRIIADNLDLISESIPHEPNPPITTSSYDESTHLHHALSEKHWDRYIESWDIRKHLMPTFKAGKDVGHHHAFDIERRTRDPVLVPVIEVFVPGTRGLYMTVDKYIDQTATVSQVYTAIHYALYELTYLAVLRGVERNDVPRKLKEGPVNFKGLRLVRLEDGRERCFEVLWPMSLAGGQY